MDADTMILLTLLAGAVIWMITLQFTESKRLAERKAREEKDQTLRTERVRQLQGRR
jgi:Tfp pilus assembly protein PilO